MRTIRALVLLMAAGVVLAAAVPSWAGEILTNEEVAARATRILVDRVEEALRPLQGDSSGIALQAQSPSAFNQWFEDRLAPRLIDTGWKVWILDDEQEPAEGSLLLKYEVSRSDLSYPAERHGFLGLGTPKIEREIALAVKARVMDPASGRLFWQREFDSTLQDVFDASALSMVESGQPEWIGKPLLDDSAKSKSGLVEKVVIAALVGSVIALYVSGAQ